MKKLILAFFGIFLMLSLCSCASLNLSEFEFRLKDDGTYIVDPGPLFDYKESLVIPESHNGIPVTEIGSFSGRANLKSLTIPYGVTRITGYAFYNCTNLSSITIPEGVTEIGACAFKNCTNLRSITIPEGVARIGGGAFSGCTNLTSISIPSTLKTAESDLFGGCDNLRYTKYDNAYYLGNDSNPCVLLVKAKETTISTCKINDTTKIVHPYAFYNCSNLESIEIPGSVISIGASAFKNCWELENIEIPNGVVSIGAHAFSECKITSVAIPASVANIDPEAFGNRLSSIEVDDDNPYYKAINGSLYNKDGTEILMYVGGEDNTEFIIPYGVTAIGECAFCQAKNLKSITIPDSVTSIGAWAFDNCSSLTSVTIPDSVETIENSAFRFCTKLERIKLGEGITEIENDTFYYCKALTEIIIPDSVTRIGYSAFAECTNLAQIIIPKSVTTLESSVFHGCENLTIYCEADKKPDSWANEWNYNNVYEGQSYYIHTVWGYKKDS